VKTKRLRQELPVPDGGHLSVLGLNPQVDRHELHERVGFQLQQSALPPKIRVGEAVETLRLWAQGQMAPVWLNKVYCLHRKGLRVSAEGQIVTAGATGGGR
jgi:ABC-type multidrug transport system ATPase subunit